MITLNTNADIQSFGHTVTQVLTTSDYIRGEKGYLKKRGKKRMSNETKEIKKGKEERNDKNLH